jgi:tetratricopeptide (TPR) repeat protein
MVDAVSGEVLLSGRVRADDASAILDAIDELSEHLRERIGESLSTLRAEPALAVVTTTNLEALRKYTEAVRAIETEGNQERGIALLEEAATLDPDFAMAWRKLGTELNNRNEDRARTVEALTRAYELRDRLTRREQYLTAATYYTSVTNEGDKAVTAYENLLDLEPDNDRALNNLGNAYSTLGDLPRAEEFFVRAAVVDSSNSIPFTNAVGVQVNLGMYEEAAAMLERSGRLFPDDPYVRQYRALFLGLTEDPQLATDSISALRDDWIGSLFWRGQLNGALAAQAAVRGRLAAHETANRDAIQSLELRDLPGEVLESAVSGAWIDLNVRRAPDRAVVRIEAALASHPLEDIDPLDRPYLQLAALYAAAGRVDEANRLLTEYGETIPEHARRGMEPDELRARGMLAVAEGRIDEGLALIQRSDFGLCQFCMRSTLAVAAGQAGSPDAAIAALEDYLAFEDLFRFNADQAVLGPTLERLGQLYDERGDLDKAAEYYAQFVELWAEADEELQPRVRAAQARLEEIVRERG